MYYLFMFQFKLMKDGLLVFAMEYEELGRVSVSRVGLVHCQQGEHLWVEATSGDSFKGTGSVTSFYGLLLHVV